MSQIIITRFISTKWMDQSSGRIKGYKKVTESFFIQAIIIINGYQLTTKRVVNKIEH